MIEFPFAVSLMRDIVCARWDTGRGELEKEILHDTRYLTQNSEHRQCLPKMCRKLGNMCRLVVQSDVSAAGMAHVARHLSIRFLP